MTSTSADAWSSDNAGMACEGQHVYWWILTKLRCMLAAGGRNYKTGSRHSGQLTVAAAGSNSLAWICVQCLWSGSSTTRSMMRCREAHVDCGHRGQLAGVLDEHESACAGCAGVSTVKGLPGCEVAGCQQRVPRSCTRQAVLFPPHGCYGLCIPGRAGRTHLGRLCGSQLPGELTRPAEPAGAGMLAQCQAGKHDGRLPSKWKTDSSRHRTPEF